MGRFFKLAPEPLEFEAVLPQRIDRVGKVQTSLFKCQGRRWFDADWSKTPMRTLRQVIGDEASFNFRPYSFASPGVLPNLFFTHCSGSIPFGPWAISVALKNLTFVRTLTSVHTRSENRDTLWPTTLRGLFGKSGSTREPWWSR